MKYSSFMIDLETLSTGPRAAITQIGVCAFDLAKRAVGSSFRIDVSPHPDSEIDFDTVCWWMQQDDAARQSVFAAPMRETPEGAIRQLENFIHQFAEEPSTATFWAMPPTFDITILAHLYFQVKRQPIWAYNAFRDVRTIMELAGISKDQRTRPAIKHDAASDAWAQAMDTVKASISLSDRDRPWMECFTETGIEWREVSHVEVATDSRLPLFGPRNIPMLSPGEVMRWELGSHRPIILRG